MERARLTGRIEDTRIQMVARIVRLRDVPGLHAEEISAMDKAHRMLPSSGIGGETSGIGRGTVRCGRELSAIEGALRQVRSIALRLRS
jgi:hypothetical protein